MKQVISSLWLKAVALGQMTIAAPATPIKRARASDVQLDYMERGEAAEPVVFVHGALSDYRTWTKA